MRLSGNDYTIKDQLVSVGISRQVNFIGIYHRCKGWTDQLAFFGLVHITDGNKKGCNVSFHRLTA